MSVMYSIKDNIRQLVVLMARHGVSDVVISPGSRNMPLAQTFASMEEMRCYAVTDERSAGFFALGIAQRKNRPVAVCVTSGSALLNLASAVSEAFYQRIPLLVVSADRPAAWIGQMDGQTLPQTGVFGPLVKFEANLCEPSDETERWLNNRLINEALIALRKEGDGPVHINVPITEPFFDCSATDLPNERVVRLRNLKEHVDELRNAWRSSKSPLVVVGQLSPIASHALLPLLSGLDAPVLCESLSNLPSSRFIHNSDLTLLADGNRAELAPDLVVYLGGHIVSKCVKQWLRKVRPSLCWRVSENGAVEDTFQSLTDVVQTTPEDFLSMLQGVVSSDHNVFLGKWTLAEHHTRELMGIPEDFSSIRVATLFCAAIPAYSSLVLANSSAVRYGQLATLAEGVQVFCNRGVNGIDGSLSSAVGIASAEPSVPVFLLIGDLSFFYDMNAFWKEDLPSNLHVLLLNNGGGGIFRTLPGLEENEGTNRLVMASHNASARGWVESLDCQYVAVRDENGLLANMSAFIEGNDGPVVMEVFSDPQADEEAHRRFYCRFE